jgi:hypothetical protein
VKPDKIECFSASREKGEKMTHKVLVKRSQTPILTHPHAVTKAANQRQPIKQAKRVANTNNGFTF